MGELVPVTAVSLPHHPIFNLNSDQHCQVGTLGGNTVYHMGTLSRASKNRDMARESEKQQQVKREQVGQKKEAFLAKTIFLPSGG